MYYDKYLASNLDELKKKVLEYDGDGFIVVDGGEDSVKHILALQAGRYLSEKESKIVSDGDSFHEAVINSKKGDCIIYDMVFEDVKKSTRLIDTLSEIQQKNIYLIFIVPTFFELPRAIACWRTTFLLHCYIVGNRKEHQRGFFQAYGYDKKNKLYGVGKKTFNYKLIKPDFEGRFTNEVDAKLGKEMLKQRQERVRLINKNNRPNSLIKVENLLAQQQHLSTGCRER